MEKEKWQGGEEITLRELLLSVKDFWLAIRASWKIIALGALLGVGALVFKLWWDPVEYTAKLSFMLNEENKSEGFNPLAGILPTQGENNLEKMLALMRSRKIMQKAFFTKEIIGEEENYLGNHIIKLNEDLQENWVDSPFEGFQFEHTDVDTFTIQENIAFKTIHSLCLGTLESDISPSTNIMTIEFYSTNEELSYVFCNTLFDVLGEYYIEQAIEKQKETYLEAKSRADSVSKELNSLEAQMATFKDRNSGIFKAKSSLSLSRLNRRFLELGALNRQVVANKEIAKANLDNKTPVIQPIDLPIYPLKKTSKSWLTYFIYALIGAFLGLFLAVGFIITRKIIRDALAEED